MEIKYNEATVNRPDGDRVIDAPFIFIDIPKYIKQLKEEDAWKKNDRNSITVFKTDQLTMVLLCLHKNAMIKDVAIEGPLTVQVIEGQLKIQIGEVSTDVETNKVLALHAYMQHSITAIEETTALLTVHVSPITKAVV